MSFKWYDIPLSLFNPIGYGLSRVVGEGAASGLSSAFNSFKQINGEDSGMNILDLVQSERDWNSAEAQKNREFQERMANTQVQRAVSDIKSAGLNPWLAVQSGSALSGGIPSGDSASSSAMSSVLNNQMNRNTQLMSAMLQSLVNISSSAMKVVAGALK